MSENNKPKPSAATMEIRRKRRAAARRKRMILLIVILLVVIIAVGLLVMKLFGGLDSIPETGALNFEKNGKVVCQEVATFEEDYYKKSELKSFVKEEIDAYNKEAGSGKVKLDELAVSAQKAYLKTTYATVEDYQAFTGNEVFVGSLKKAKKQYDFEEAFVAVDNGQKSDSVDSLEILSQKGLKVVVVRANGQVKVDGTILYVSDEATSMIDKSTVVITQENESEDAAQLSYIIYK